MNPTMNRLKEILLSSPEIKYQKNSVRGYVSAVYYDERRCDVAYWTPEGVQATKRKMHFPKDGDGLFNQSLKTGDIVELSYKGRSSDGLHITGVQKRNKSRRDFYTEKGQGLPISTNLF